MCDEFIEIPEKLIPFYIEIQKLFEEEQCKEEFWTRMI